MRRREDIALRRVKKKKKKKSQHLLADPSFVAADAFEVGEHSPNAAVFVVARKRPRRAKIELMCFSTAPTVSHRLFAIARCSAPRPSTPAPRAPWASARRAGRPGGGGPSAARRPPDRTPSRRRRPAARTRRTRPRRRPAPSAGSRRRLHRPRAGRSRSAPRRTGRARGSPSPARFVEPRSRRAGPRRYGSAACGRRRWRGRDGGARPRGAVAVPDALDDLDLFVGEQPRQTLAQQHRVLGDHDAHGSSALTIVGPPSGLETVSVPSMVAARVIRPSSPPPGARAPPTPSSSTSSDDVPVLRMRTSSRVAAACFAAFVRASATTKYAVDSIATGGRSSRSTEISTGIGLRAASADSEASRPRSVRIAGWIPRARFLSSARACFESSWACSTSARAPWDPCRAGARAAEVDREGGQPLLRPSWRSRSMRRRSETAASTASVRCGSAPRPAPPSGGRAACAPSGMGGYEEAEDPRQDREEDQADQRAGERLRERVDVRGPSPNWRPLPDP